jgi:hypothetical protein
VIAPDARIDAALEVLAHTAPGATPAELSALLPEGIGEVLVAAILETARADDVQLNAINATARGEAPPAEYPAGSGAATISWRAPTESTDRSPVGRINHYTLYYGRSADQLDRQIRIGAGQTRFQVRDLEPGTWYFALTATARGIESAKSNIRSKTIS